MIELEYFDYDKAELSVTSEGKQFKIGVLSAMSIEYLRAASVFDKQVEAAKARDIPLVDEVTVGDITIEEPNDQYKALNAYLSKSIVCDWPFDSEIETELAGNQALCNAIQAKAHEVSKEYAKKKSN